MNDLKGGQQGSVFPVKLLIGYLIVISLMPTIFSFWDSGNIEESIELWNLNLALSLILCIPLLFVIGLSIWHFRRMPYFTSIAVTWSLLIAAEAIGSYYSYGFDSRFDIDLSRIKLTGLFETFVIFAVPFIVIYLIRRFWPRRQAEGLPAS